MVSVEHKRPRKKRADAYHHGDLKSALVDAALHAAHKLGPAGINVKEIAAKVGVSDAAVYHHFTDRNALLAAAAARGFAILTEETDRASNDLAGFAEAYVRFALRHPGAFRLAFGSHVAETLAKYDVVVRVGRPLKQRVFELAQAHAAHTGEEADDLFHMVWAQAHGIATLVTEDELGGVTEDRALALVRASVARLLGHEGQARRSVVARPA